MKCDLCGKEIKNYSVEFNQLKVREDKSVNICQDCLDKIFKWHGSNMAKLFPTKGMKKRFGKE